MKKPAKKAAAKKPAKKAAAKKPSAKAWANPAAVAALLNKLPRAPRAALLELRAWILEVAPDAEEGISYGMPAYKNNGATVGFAAFKNHLSFFPFSGTFLDAYAEELSAFSRAPSGVHFTPEHRLPKALLQRIVLDRFTAGGHRGPPSKTWSG